MNIKHLVDRLPEWLWRDMMAPEFSNEELSRRERVALASQKWAELALGGWQTEFVDSNPASLGEAASQPQQTS